MARIRSIKPEFWESETIGRRSLLARLTFIGLWNLADDRGRGRGDSGAIWGRLHSYQGSAVKARWKRALRELEKPDRDGIPFVTFYKVGHDTYFWLPTFCVHQKIDHPSPSKLPAHPEETLFLARIRERLALEMEQGAGSKGEEQGEGGPPPDSAAPGDAPEGGAEGVASDAEIADAYCALDETVPRPKVLGQVRRAVAEGVGRDALLAAVKQHGARMKIWSIKDLLIEKKGLQRNGASSGSLGGARVAPQNPDYLKEAREVAQKRQDEARAACDAQLASMPTEEIAAWTREAEEQAAREKVLAAGLKMFVTGVLRRRAAEKFGIAGL